MEWLHPHLWAHRHPGLGILYSSVALSTIANALIGIFVPIFLYRSGYSLIQVLLFFMLSSLYFLLFAKAGVWAVARWGIRWSMLISIFFWIAYFAGLHFLPHFSYLFFILPCFLALKGVFHNFAFHLYFIEHSERKKIGHEVSATYSTIQWASFLGPVVGGWILVDSSWSILLGLCVFLLVLSVLPLFLVPERKQKVDFSYKDIWRDLLDRRNWGCVASFTGYSVESFINYVVWPIFLATLFSSLEKVGFLVSVSLCASLIVLHFAGKWFDGGLKKKLLNISTGLFALGWLLRLFMRSSWSVGVMDSFKNISGETLNVSWSAYNYDVAGKHFFRFIVFREIIFNLGRTVFMPILMFLIYVGAGFKVLFILGALFSLLYAAMRPYHPAI
ncbi:MAG: MFS transporter [Nanoarchaeota archaeon]